jgi:DNA-binding XRE family transcriptional regulator
LQQLIKQLLKESIFKCLVKKFIKFVVLLKKLIFLHKTLKNMNEMPINRLKAVLAEQSKTNKWLAEKLNKNETTISRWCTNETQPSMDTFIAIANLLSIDVRELINPTKK